MGRPRGGKIRRDDSRATSPHRITVTKQIPIIRARRRVRYSYARGMLITRIYCPVCARDSSEGHRICHDDVVPPDPSGLWGFRCPLTQRIVMVDVRHIEWTNFAGQRHFVELEQQPASLLDFLPRAMRAAVGE